MTLLLVLCGAGSDLTVFAQENGNVFHVSQSLGHDGNSGTDEAPFATIGKCAHIARPGDTCLVHEGIYRETVKPRRDGKEKLPISFRAAPGEQVRITGLDEFAGKWTRLENAVYQTVSVEPVKQVFVGDTPLHIARFPDSPDHFTPEYAEITHAKCKTLAGTWSPDYRDCAAYDEDGACGVTNNCWDKSFPKIRWRIRSDALDEAQNWNNGTIAILDGGHFNAERAVIINTYPGKEIEFERFNEKPVFPGLLFYISNSMNAVNTSGEWAYDPGEKQLYIKPHGSGMPENIQIRTRDLAFDLRGKTYINVSGFEIVAASVKTDSKSRGCVLDNLSVSYPVYHQMYGASTNYPGQGANRHSITDRTLGTGVTLGGTDNVLKNSTITKSWCDGVTVYGSSNIVSNNTISDVNWSMTACAAVAVNGNNHLITRNRMHDCGRACLWYQQTTDSEISYNDIYNACWLGKDCGVTGSYGWFGKNKDASSDHDGDGTGNILHHNWIHDNRNAHGGACLYLDNNEQDYLVHHNVLWGCEIAFILNDTYIGQLPTGHKLYNNTCFDVEYRMSDFGGSREWALNGVEFKNNLCSSSKDAHYNPFNKAELRMEHNIGPHDPNLYAQPVTGSAWTADRLGLKDIQGRDFRPTLKSPAYQMGVAIPGITHTMDKPPAAGAHENEEDTWKAGPQ